MKKILTILLFIILFSGLGFAADTNLTSASITVDDLTVVNTISGSIDGQAGTVATITGLAPDTATTQATQPSITSVGTLTTLQIDNININGNTVLSTAGTDLYITPLAGQQLILDGTMIIDAGQITGISSLGLTGTRITNGYFTNLAATNTITGSISGNAVTVTGYTPASGSLTLSGADALTLITTGVTSITLPTTGTVATTSQLHDAVTIGTGNGLSLSTQALSFGIANNNAVEIDDIDAADNDYTKFTTTGLEGRSYSEVRSDLGLVIGTNVQAHSTILDATTASFVTADETKLDYISVTQAVDLDTMESNIATNNAKNTNVPTELSTGTVTATSYGITSDGGSDDIILAQATTDYSGVLSATKFDEIVANNAKITCDATGVTNAGALMDSEVDADIKTLSLPASTTISTFGKSLVDDADVSTARSTLDVDQAGTDNSVAVTLDASATTGGMSISTQTISNQVATNAQNGYMTSTLVGNIETNNAKVSYPGSADAGELNILDGATITTIELNYVHGVTSDIQTQLGNKQDTLGYTAENSANKKTTLTDSDTDYPTCKAVNTGLNGKQDSLTFGIADTNKVQINDAGVADDEYARFTATGLEGRTTADVLSDIGGQASDAALTSISNLAYASDSFIKLTATDTYAVRTLTQVKEDLNLNNVENTAISTWSGTTNIATVGTLTTGSLSAGFTDVPVAQGGTGVSTLLDHGVLVGSGASAITALTVGTNGQILIGSTGADPVFAALNCADSLTCTTGAGTLEINVDDDFLKNSGGDTGSGNYILQDNITVEEYLIEGATGYHEYYNGTCVIRQIGDTQDILCP